MDFRNFKATYLSGVVLLVFMQAMDVGMTYFALYGSPHIIEMNPLMRGVVDDILPFAVVKVVGVAFVLVLGELFSKFFCKSIAHSIIWVAAGFSACVVWNNMMVILLSSGLI
jgi:hypothetical protein